MAEQRTPTRSEVGMCGDTRIRLAWDETVLVAVELWLSDEQHVVLQLGNGIQPIPNFGCGTYGETS